MNGRRTARWIVIVMLASAACADARAPREVPGSRLSSPTPRVVTGVDTENEGLEVGVPYRIRLYTHCGLDFWTRFDGSYWDAVGYDNSSGNPPRWMGNPSDVGTMTLLSHGEAEYRSESGHVIRYTRAQERPKGMVCL